MYCLIVALTILTGFCQQSLGNSCEMTRRSFLAALSATAVTAAAPGLVRGGATAALSGVEKKSIHQIIGLMCKQSARVRSSIRGVKLSRPLDPAEREQVKLVLKELRKIGGDPSASRRITHITRGLVDKGRELVRIPTSSQPKSSNRPQEERRGGRPQQSTSRRGELQADRDPVREAHRQSRKVPNLNRVIAVSSQGLVPKLIKFGGALSLISSIFSGSPARGSIGDYYLDNYGEYLPSFFDLPPEEQAYLLEMNNVLARIINEYLENTVEHLGGAPKDLECSSGNIKFRINTSGPQGSHRTVDVFRSRSGDIKHLIVKEFNGRDLLHEGKFEFQVEIL